MNQITNNIANRTRPLFLILRKKIALISYHFFSPKFGIVHSPLGESNHGEQKKKDDKNTQKQPTYPPKSDETSKNKEKAPTLSFLSEQLNNLILDLIEVKSELLQEQKQKEQLLREIQYLHEEKKRFEQQKDLLNEEIHLLKKQLQETESSLKTVEQQLFSTQADYQIDKTKLREIQEKLHQKEQENIELTTQQVEDNETIHHLTKKIQNISIDLSNALIRNAELESINQQLENRLDEKNSLLKNREDEIQKHQLENEHLKAQISELHTNIKSLRIYIDTQQKLTDKLMKDKESLLKENRKLESEIAKIISEQQKQKEQQQTLEQKHHEIIEQCQGLLKTIEGLKKESHRFQQEYRLAVKRNEELSETLKYWKTQVETLKEQLTLIEDAEIIEEKKKFEDAYIQLILSQQTIETPYLKLGELFVKAGFISSSQLEELLFIQKSKKHYRLGTLLLEKGWIDEYILFQALSLQKNIPLLFVSEKHVNIEQAYLLGYTFCLEHLLLPLRTQKTDRALIATADPENALLLQEVKELFNRPVKSVFSCPSHIIEIIEKIFDRT